jgi:hypothetical protein
MQGRPPAWVADVDLNCLDGVDNPTLVRSRKAVAWARGAMRTRDLDVFARYKAKAATKTKKARPQELEKDWHARLLKDACTRLKATSLPEKVLDQFELDVRRWEFPRSMGPVLGKLGHKMSKFTGAEYKNLLNTCFSVMAEPHLTDAEYGLVHHLREVSRLLDDRIVRKNHIDEIHDYLLEYQKMYMKVYGADSLTPNNHKSTHLGDCMLDYGCVHGFWLFAFERYNGLAKATNWRNGNLLEVSMRQFTNHSRLLALLSEPSFRDGMTAEQTAVVDKLLAEDVKGPATQARDPDTQASQALLIAHHYCRTRKVATPNTWADVNGTEPFPGDFCNRGGAAGEWQVVAPDELAQARLSLQALYHKNVQEQEPTASTFSFLQWKVYEQLQLGGQTFGSKTMRDAKTSYVIVLFRMDAANKKKQKKNEASDELHPDTEDGMTWASCQVQRYIKVTVERYTTGQGGAKRAKIGDAVHWLAEVRWFQRAETNVLKWHTRYSLECHQHHALRPTYPKQQRPMHSNYRYIPVQRIARGFVPLPLEGRNAGSMHIGWMRSPFEF